MNSILVRHKWEPYLWLLPSILLMGIFVVYPIGIVFKLSFSEISRSGLVGDFNGLDNYINAVMKELKQLVAQLMEKYG